MVVDKCCDHRDTLRGNRCVRTKNSNGWHSDDRLSHLDRDFVELSVDSLVLPLLYWQRLVLAVPIRRKSDAVGYVRYQHHADKCVVRNVSCDMGKFFCYVSR
jgi:hypothetical protein